MCNIEHILSVMKGLLRAVPQEKLQTQTKHPVLVSLHNILSLYPALNLYLQVRLVFHPQSMNIPNHVTLHFRNLIIAYGPK